MISYINIRTEYDTCQLNYMGIKYMMCVSILLFKISSITRREYIYGRRSKNINNIIKYFRMYVCDPK